MILRFATMGLLAGALAACGPSPKLPLQTVALVKSKSGALEPAQVELKTVKNAVTLQGDVATFIGGARIVLDVNDPQNLSDEQYARYITKNGGGEVHVNYIEKDGLLWPADFDSWNLVSSYHNLEKAHDYFVGIGVPSDELKGSQFFYFPEVVNTAVSRDPLKDNMLFLQPLRAFVALPFDKIQKVPLPLNYGLVAHEYSHKLWNLRVYGGRGQPEAISRWAASGVNTGLNLVKALDEGLADFHAYGATCLAGSGCDPRFVSASVDATITGQRDLSKADRCLSTSERASLESMAAGDFLTLGMDYKVGTVIASALYQAGEKTGKRQDLQRAVLAAYSDDNSAKPGVRQLVNQNLDSPAALKLELVADAILSHVDDTELKKQTCNELWGRLKLEVGGVMPMKHCPSFSAPVPDCSGVQ